MNNPLREGLARRRTPGPTTLVLFGASGDLVRRKLMPALYNLARDGLLPAKYAIVGVARRPWGETEFRAEMLGAVRDHARAYSDADKGAWEELTSRLFYHRGSLDELECYRSLAGRLDQVDRELGLPANRLHYLAVAPRFFAPVVANLGKVGLAPNSRTPSAPMARVVVEKPFGRDLESSRALNRDLLSVLDEDQIFRIDHYLGKETVQNILALRFANGIFEPLFNQKYVQHVQITVAEEIGVGERGGYYDHAGALRDMAQNHLLQLLTLVAMEPPVELEANAIRDEKLKVLRAVRPIPASDVHRYVVRGQYTRGAVLGREVPGYLEGEEIPTDSKTETYVAMRLEIESWRWAGVPFLLRTGKCLPKRTTEIYIQFRKPPLRLFGEETASGAAPNALIINVQPDEGISLRFGAKLPGPDMEVRQVKMDFRYGTSFGVPSPEAYERLLLDAMSGDSTLFTRRDEVEAAWELMTAVLEGWSRSGDSPFPYAAGSWGPQEAEQLLEGLDGGWRRL